MEEITTITLGIKIEVYNQPGKTGEVKINWMQLEKGVGFSGYEPY